MDLGAGIGLHTLALARLGFRVTALENCQVLLDELKSRCAGLRVNAVHADLLEFGSFLKGQPQVIVCMGDTLTHLPTLAAVEGVERFIPVRADADRILTCFLEYGSHAVTVHDVLNERKDGEWRQKVSSYPKLRLAPAWVETKLADLGFDVRRDSSSNRMARIIATKV